MKKILLSVLFFQSLYAYDLDNELSNKTREEKKVICENKMNENINTHPKIAYQAANCLLYNGYGELSIPLFSAYLTNGFNKKYFDNRFGYSWLQVKNPYKINPIFLKEMTGGKEIFNWIGDEINKELHLNYKKYNLELKDLLKRDYDIMKRTKKLPKVESFRLEVCDKAIVNINNIKCDVINFEYKNCIPTKNKDVEIKCLDAKFR